MFIGWWLQAVFYSPAPYRSLGIKLESQITAAGLCVPLQKLYGKGNNIVLCYPSTLPCLSPKDLREWVSCSSSRVVQRPPRKLQLLGSAGSQSGNSRAGSRCSVSLPWASLVMHFLVWIFCLSLYLFFLIWIGCKCPETTICSGIGFFQGQCAVYTRCPMFVWTFIGITDWNGKCFCVCTILTHPVSKSTVAHIFSHSHLCLQCFKEYSKISWHRQSEAVCKIPSCGTTKATFWTHITHDFNKSLKQKSDNVFRKWNFATYGAAHGVEGSRYPLVPPFQCLFPSSAHIFIFCIRTLKKKCVFK